MYWKKPACPDLFRRAAPVLARLGRPVQAPSYGICRWGDLSRQLPCRGASRLPEKPRSVILFPFPYYAGEYPERNLARYAMAADYHRLAGARLGRAVRALARRFPGMPLFLIPTVLPFPRWRRPPAPVWEGWGSTAF